MKTPLLLAWSGGKDSALALRALRRSGRYRVAGLLTTATNGYNRITMHGVRLALLRKQAASLGLPLRLVRISKKADDKEYRKKMGEAMAECRKEGIRTVAFGDLYLRDVRQYRERALAEAGMKAVFPLWKINTGTLAREFIRLGFKAVLTCVDTEKLDGSFAGRDYDASLLSQLPKSADPCGENGEFHTFVHGGPGFREPVRFKKGARVLREKRFCFCDLIPRKNEHGLTRMRRIGTDQKRS